MIDWGLHGNMCDHGSSPATCVFTCVNPMVIPAENVKVRWRLATCGCPPFCLHTLCFVSSPPVIDRWIFFGSNLLTMLLYCQSLYRALLCSKVNQLVLSVIHTVHHSSVQYSVWIAVDLFNTLGLANLCHLRKKCLSWFFLACNEFYNLWYFCLCNLSVVFKYVITVNRKSQ